MLQAPTITFRIDDGLDTLLPTPAVITTDQLGSLRDLLAEQGERLGFCLLFPEHGEVSKPAFAFEARVCPLALAMVSRCFDHDPILWKPSMPDPRCAAPIRPLASS